MERSGRRATRKSDGPLQPATINFPDRLYYRIGEVARICGVAPSVLRFWESQFPNLKPNKGGTGQRLYRRRELELALRIRQLVYDEGYTLAGARQALSNSSNSSSAATPVARTASPQQPSAAASTSPSSIQRIRAELRNILEILSPQSARGRAAKPKDSAKRDSALSLFPELTEQGIRDDSAPEDLPSI